MAPLETNTRISRGVCSFVERAVERVLLSARVHRSPLEFDREKATVGARALPRVDTSRDEIRNQAPAIRIRNWVRERERERERGAVIRIH